MFYCQSLTRGCGIGLSNELLQTPGLGRIHLGDTFKSGFGELSCYIVRNNQVILHSVCRTHGVPIECSYPEGRALISPVSAQNGHYPIMS